ncbi:LrgB family protein [Fusobacterium mortiferum]|uniref:LrgB family protein n=2 Tax=Fusobacterium mortiferum TaxID=850 RepID=A0A414PYC1_FUSMR|nr:LrgB family protein [Fusobacterium mortiferum]AVQ19801.1 LrgB family protein [Fusobacterium mortiferum ATCC 9817]MCF2628799.1 LrgB family protein [Fusobacterium mortiferum]MDD7263324.1 LrgB family protein [Fusobacterium mortiferum]MDY4801766.1 LrgB family protein [Fusobacterium mortiferum]MDY5981623.1 LrgB family protein [Fusobacterium mortiferum]
MMEGITNNPLFGVIISLIAFEIGKFIFNKTKLAIFNPLLIATIIVMGFLNIFHITVVDYMLGGNLIVFFLAPATVVLAIPLFQQIDLLKKHFIPIIGGGIVGAVVAILSVIILGKLLGIDHQLLVSFMPKSITTPIGIELSKMLGGIPSITVFAIIITGITGNVTAPFIYSIFRIKNPIAKGLGLGISSHAVGTSRAIEMGKVEGAMSALSIVIAGILTIILAPILNMFL